MSFPQSNSHFTDKFLGDGVYYVFRQIQGEEIRLGYQYTTWCGSPCGIHIKLSSVELGKPLPLVRSGDSRYDKGQLKTFKIEPGNFLLMDDVYKRAVSWIYKIERELKYPHLSESVSCTVAVIQVNQGVLSALYEKDDLYKQNILLEQKRSG